MKHVLIMFTLLFAACAVETENPPEVYDNDPEPALCKDYKIQCQYGDPETEDGWHCYWRNNCWDVSERGECSDSQDYCWISRTGEKHCGKIPGPACI